MNIEESLPLDLVVFWLLWIVFVALFCGFMLWLWALSRNAYLGAELIRACGSRAAASRAIERMDQVTDHQIRAGLNYGSSEKDNKERLQ